MLNLTDEQQVLLRITPRTQAGNPARVDGIPKWVTSNPSAVELLPSEDGMECLALAVGLGGSTIGVTVDADLGDGIRLIGGAIDIAVLPAEAVSVGVEVGQPQPRSGFEGRKPGEVTPAPVEPTPTEPTTPAETTPTEPPAPTTPEPSATPAETPAEPPVTPTE